MTITSVKTSFLNQAVSIKINPINYYLGIYFEYLSILIQETEEKLKREEEAKNAVEQARKKAEAEVKAVRQEYQDLEFALEKSKQARSEKEHQIRTMQDEMDNQDTMISRLNKEKKQLQDSNQKTAEDLQVNFMYSEKAKKFCEIFTLLLTTVRNYIQSKVR